MHASPRVTGVSAHAHEHGSHEGHAHGVSADADKRKLTIALALILGFMLVEVVAGIAAGSLALLSDAGHMLTDAAAIASPWWRSGLRPGPLRAS